MNWLRHALGRLDAVAQAHSTAPVPVSQSVPGYRVALICVGIAFTLTGLYVGSDLALTLGLGSAIRANLEDAFARRRVNQGLAVRAP